MVNLETDEILSRRSTKVNIIAEMIIRGLLTSLSFSLIEVLKGNFLGTVTMSHKVALGLVD